MARSLGSFYERPSTPACPDTRCAGRSMVAIGDQAYECPDKHDEQQTTHRDAQDHPDLPYAKNDRTWRATKGARPRAATQTLSHAGERGLL